jgi:hypothetical protein
MKHADGWTEPSHCALMHGTVIHPSPTLHVFTALCLIQQCVVISGSNVLAGQLRPRIPSCTEKVESALTASRRCLDYFNYLQGNALEMFRYRLSPNLFLFTIHGYLTISFDTLYGLHLKQRRWTIIRTNLIAEVSRVLHRFYLRNYFNSWCSVSHTDLCPLLSYTELFLRGLETISDWKIHQLHTVCWLYFVRGNFL